VDGRVERLLFSVAFSNVTAQVVSIDAGMLPRFPVRPLRATLKQRAWAAAIVFSKVAPGGSSNLGR
jgi:hypothetical protein